MKPLFRWVGGKTKLLKHLAPYLPNPALLNRYFEPFMGGGALFFDYGWYAKQAYLNDSCVPLMAAYEALSRNYDEVIDCAKQIDLSYNSLREAFNVELSRDTKDYVRLATLFIMVNHLSYNGVYRVNKSGGFNCPAGSHGTGAPRTLKSLYWEGLAAGGAALQRSQLTCASFSPWPFDASPGLGDFVFYDPPYAGEYSSYAADGFTTVDHQLLHLQAQSWAERGATVVVCGSNNEWSWKVYGEPALVIPVRRTVGNSLRGDATEALYIYSKVA